MPSPELWILLIVAAGMAGLVDSIAGGGGIITVPALFAANIPAHFVFGTNKLQSSFGSLSALLGYRRAGLFRIRGLGPAIVATGLGAGLGALTVGSLDQTLLNRLMPLLLLGIFLFVLLRRDFGTGAGKERMNPLAFWLVSGLILGWYDGFFGPGTGTLWTMALVGMLGMDMKHATAHTKVVNFTSNIVSLGVFLYLGTAYIALGLCMGAAQALGAWLGSAQVIRKGSGFVRVIFLVATALVILYVIVRYWVL